MKKIRRKPKREVTRPRYNMWQNTGYMLALSWKIQKQIPCFCLLLAAAHTAGSAAQLLAVPMILSQVETAASLTSLLKTILGFTAVLILTAAAQSYINFNAMYKKIPVRIYLADQIHYKFCTTSYPNTEDAAALHRLEQAQRATKSNDASTEAVWDTLTDLLKNLAGFLLYLLVLASLPPILLLIAVSTSLVGYLANKRILEWEYRHREEKTPCEMKLHYLNNLSLERHLAKDIRIFHMRPWLDDLTAGALRLYRSFFARRERVFLWTDILDMAMTFLRNGVSYAFLIGLALAGGITASQFLLYFTAVGGFTGWVGGILDGLATLHRQSLDISTLREFLELPEPFAFKEGLPLTAPADGRLELCLEHVGFRYPEAEKDTLHDVNLTIRPGEKLAVVGLNGAGKTTLIKLLCGFYDPTEGRILLNGQDIRRYNRRDYYRLFSAVFQQFSLLEATLSENVSQTPSDRLTRAEHDRIAACIEKAGLAHKVDSLPAHLDTHLGRQVYEDGVELSGGEIQRLMLARALYKEGSILVLDEPTAALDPIAENDIYLKYNEMTACRTSIFISHRLASTHFCDRILFLSGGQIAEEGTHDSLMEKDGAYARLFRVQSKYYQEGASAHAK